MTGEDMEKLSVENLEQVVGGVSIDELDPDAYGTLEAIRKSVSEYSFETICSQIESCGTYEEAVALIYEYYNGFVLPGNGTRRSVDLNAKTAGKGKTGSKKTKKK